MKCFLTLPKTDWLYNQLQIIVTKHTVQYDTSRNVRNPHQIFTAHSLRVTEVSFENVARSQHLLT